MTRLCSKDLRLKRIFEFYLKTVTGISDGPKRSLMWKVRNDLTSSPSVNRYSTPSDGPLDVREICMKIVKSDVKSGR